MSETSEDLYLSFKSAEKGLEKLISMQGVDMEWTLSNPTDGEVIIINDDEGCEKIRRKAEAHYRSMQNERSMALTKHLAGVRSKKATPPIVFPKDQEGG